MRDPKRIERILSKLATYWRQNPDLRLAQIVMNCCSAQHAGLPVGLFYFEDEELENELERALGWEDKK